MTKNIRMRKMPVMTQKAISSLESHAKTEPPKFMAMIRKADPPMRTVVPTQSTNLSFDRRVLFGRFSKSGRMNR